MATDREEILLLPFFGQGHLFPFLELSKHLSKHDYKITLIISSSVISSIPSSLTVDYPLIQIFKLPPPLLGASRTVGPPMHAFGQNEEIQRGIESLLSSRLEDSKRRPPACAVIDTLLGRSKVSFTKFGVPTVLFTTSSACFAAVEYAMWKSCMKPGEISAFPGLPDEMVFSYEEVNRRRCALSSLAASSVVPDEPFLGNEGLQPPWLEDIKDSVAILINTCTELEGVYLDYLEAQLAKPVLGVGPLLPEQYWRSTGSILQDKDFRPTKISTHSEEEIIQWLDSKSHTSVLYISFGSEVQPNKDEFAELATALEEMNNTSFIWVVRSSTSGPLETDQETDEGYYYPHGLDAKVGKRGLIIHGWAPQLLILSHPSTCGFLSHCGWNSTIEAIGYGVPFLAWPIRADQFYNAKMVVNHLKIGYLVKESMGLSEMVKKDDIIKGVEKLMGDIEVKRRADLLKKQLQGGFPNSSQVALQAFGGIHVKAKVDQA